MDRSTFSTTQMSVIGHPTVSAGIPPPCAHLFMIDRRAARASAAVAIRSIVVVVVVVRADGDESCRWWVDDKVFDLTESGPSLMRMHWDSRFNAADVGL